MLGAVSDDGPWWTSVRPGPPGRQSRPPRRAPQAPGGSALKPAGGSREWGRIRARWAGRLPVPCGQCGGMVTPDQPWSLGHRVPRSHGGTDEEGNLWPEHRGCSDRSGGREGRAAQLAAVPASRDLPPSREW